MFLSILVLFLQVSTVLANTEKVVFLGPGSIQIPTEPPTLGSLQLDTLSHDALSIRTHLKAEFPSDISDYGQSTWLLLDGLKEGKRYEVRICWAATQPTSFRLDTYELSTVFETPALILSLAQFSESQQLASIEDHTPSISQTLPKEKRVYDEGSSVLFLHIQAAADYFTMNQTLMRDVPPVFVDIILDPFLFNVLPQSLVPTIAYIILLAVGSWYLSKRINRFLQSLCKDNEVPKKKAL